MFTIKTMGKVAICLFCSYFLFGNALAEGSKHIDGVVVDVKGQRIAVRDKNDNVAWVSLQIASEQTIDASLVGKTIRGEVSKIGDAIIVTSPVFSE